MPRCPVRGCSAADSAEFWDEADPGECACPYGGDTFAVAVGFSLRDGGDVRWISIGLRCLTDNTLGVYADWKINYGPRAISSARHSRISLQHATTQGHDLRLE